MIHSGAMSEITASLRAVKLVFVGDSITEGGSTFSNWRYPLWEKLYTAGYLVEYTGTRKSPSRIGDLPHEGYGGKNSGFLAATVPANFEKSPADIVLLHAGHNHFAEEKPVPQILKDTEALIAAFRTELAAPTVPFVVGQLGQFAGSPWNEFKTEVDRAHRALPQKVPHTAFVPSDGLKDKGDKTHFDATRHC